MSRAGDDCGFTISIYNLNKATQNCSQQRARIKHQSIELRVSVIKKEAHHSCSFIGMDV